MTTPSRIRTILLAVVLLTPMALPALAGRMSPEKCKKACATVVEQCKQACEEHVKRPDAKTKCKNGCTKSKKKCLEHCPKM